MTHFQVDYTVGRSLLRRRAHLEAILGYSFLPPGSPCESLLSARIKPKEGVAIILALLVSARPRAHNKLFSWEPISIAFLAADRGPA